MVTIFVLIYTNSCCTKIEDKSYFFISQYISFLLAHFTLTIIFEWLDKDISPGGSVVGRLTSEAGV